MSIDPTAFTRRWIAAWNRRDIEAVLALYAETATIVTPQAEDIIGRAEARGKTALRQYWSATLAQIGTLVFTYEQAAWDPLQRLLTMRYVATVDGISRRAAEIATINADGLIRHSDALYGAFIVEDASTADA